MDELKGIKQFVHNDRFLVEQLQNELLEMQQKVPLVEFLLFALCSPFLCVCVFVCLKQTSITKK